MTPERHHYRQPGRAEARCQHCPADLVQLDNGVWVDGAGFARCAKGVDHQPMPAVSR